MRLKSNSSLSAGTPSVQTYAEPGHAASVSLSSFIHHSCCVCKALFPCCLPSQLVFMFFMPHLLKCSLSPKRRDLMKKYPLSLSVPSFLTLCMFSSFESLFNFLCTTGGSFFDDYWVRHMNTICAPLANSNFYFFHISLPYVVSGA